MSDEEAAFQRHLEQSTNYFNAVRKHGDLPWFEQGHERRAKRIEELGLAEDVSEEDLRRAVFMRRFK